MEIGLEKLLNDESVVKIGFEEIREEHKDAMEKNMAYFAKHNLEYYLKTHKGMDWNVMAIEKNGRIVLICRVYDLFVFNHCEKTNIYAFSGHEEVVVVDAETLKYDKFYTR